MELDLSNKCRACLNEEEGMHDLFLEFDQGITLQEILSTTTNFQVEKEDGFSPFLCQNCTTIIVDFYNFKTVYKENENQIKALLNSVENNSDGENTDENVENLNLSEEKPQIEELQQLVLNEEENEDDYITIKVESDDGSEEDCDFELPDYSSKKGPKKGIDQFVLTEEETDSFDPEDENTPAQYEYQKITTFTCSKCGEYFLYQNDIEQHLLLKHEITEFNIEELAKTAFLKVIKVDQNVHFAMSKRKVKKNICDICGVGFTKKSYLKDHQEVHSNEKNHICNYCNKAFKRRTVLVKHKRIHTHPRECVCEICGKAFNDKGTLKTHIMLLHVKQRNYICLICGVKFPLKSTLEKHIRRHQNKEREFFCTQCPLGYRDKSSLDRHIYVKHSGENVKSACEECGKQYTTMSSLLKHKRIAHEVTSTEVLIVENNE